MRLIDKDAILHDLENGVYPASMTYTLAVDIAKGLIEVASEIDAVSVVRCGECRYRELAKVNCKGYTICPASGMEITDDDFCSYGERKEDRK